MKEFNLNDYNSVRDLSNVELGPRQAILAFCKECCGFNNNEARLCPSKTCPLWRLSRKYMGLIKNESSRPKRTLTEAQRQIQIERLRIARERKLSNED